MINQLKQNLYIFLLVSTLLFFGQSQETNQTEQVVHKIPVKGGINNKYYYVDLYVGTPPQKQSLILDTGSGITTMSCNKCGDKCGKHENNPFQTDQSSTFSQFKCSKKDQGDAKQFSNFQCPAQNCDSKQNQCKYQISYSEKSMQKGTFVQDFVSFQEPIHTDNNNTETNNNSTNSDDKQERIFALFGCNNEETNLIYRQKADGIMALGTPSNTTAKTPNLLDLHYNQLQKFHQENSNNTENYELQALSFCFGIEGGYIELGTQNNKKDDSNSVVNLQYSDSPVSQYVIEEDLQFSINNEKKINTKNEKQYVFLDSGATYSYFHYDLYESFIEKFEEFCDNDSTNCPGKIPFKNTCFYYDSSKYPENQEEFFNFFPNITMNFNNKTNNSTQQLIWQPKYYLFEQKLNLFCIGINKYPRNQKRKQISLGQTFFRQKFITINKKEKTIQIEQHRICTPDEWGQPFSIFDLSMLKNNPFFHNPVVIICVIIIVFICCYKRRQKLKQQQKQNHQDMWNEYDSAMSPKGQNNNNKQKSSSIINSNTSHYVDVNTVFDQDEELDQDDDDQYAPKEGIEYGDSDSDGEGENQHIQKDKHNDEDYYEQSYEDTFA